MCQRGIVLIFLKSPNKHISCSDPVKQCDLLVSFLTRIMYEKLNLVCSHIKFLNAQICFVYNVNVGRRERARKYFKHNYEENYTHNLIHSITYWQIRVAESILSFEVIDFRVKKIICVDGLEFINFTNYTVKKTDVFLDTDQALITGLTCSSKNSVNMFISCKLISYFYMEV